MRPRSDAAHAAVLHEVAQLCLQSCQCLLLTNERVGLLLNSRVFSDLSSSTPAVFRISFGLKQQSVFTVRPGPREERSRQHRECAAPVGRSHRPSAVANEAGFLGSTSLAVFSKRARLRRRRQNPPWSRSRSRRWTCRSPFIEAKNGNALSRQVVRQHEKSDVQR